VIAKITKNGHSGATGATKIKGKMQCAMKVVLRIAYGLYYSDDEG
jgi:hypothetical protein